ncbi:uncharacterized protein M6G45_012827 [Spheniscus humboldti]
MLDCRIIPYFTAGTRIIWPGREIAASSSDSWFTCTIKRTAGKHTATAFLVQAQKEEENPNPRQLFPGIAEQSHLSDVTAQRVSGQKGGHRKRLFAYSGSSKQVERVARRPEVVLEEIPKGNASPSLRNTETGDEGAYSCLVSVAPLTGEQTIQLQIEETPTVTINVNPLSLLEGEQHKLVCNIGHYYPHDNQAEWLREPKDSWKVPDVMKNVLSSSHWQSSNGTYSSSRYFLLTASLKDNGHKYTCWVGHPRLQSPIRRSVTVEVKVDLYQLLLPSPYPARDGSVAGVGQHGQEATSTAWLLLLLSLAVCLAGTLCYHHKVRSAAKEGVVFVFHFLPETHSVLSILLFANSLLFHPPAQTLLEMGPPVPAG